MPKIIFKDLQNYDSQMDKVFALRKKKFYSEGISLLKRMNKEFKNDKVILGLLGTLFYENNDYISSSKYFKKASELNPNSELSSLGLFHSYIEIGKITLGLKEITRFCKNNKPKLYRTTVKELNDNIDNVTKIQKKMILELPVVRRIMNK